MSIARSTDRPPPLATFLRARARQLGLSQAEVFRRMAHLEKNTGSMSSLNGWFTGDRYPGEVELRSLAKILEVAPESLFALHALETQVIRDSSMIAAALSVWPLMVAGHAEVLLLAGATMLTGVTQLLVSRPPRGTTILVSTLGAPALAAYESHLNGRRRDSAFLRASWLATTDLLLDLAGEADGPRVRLWVRDEAPVCDAFQGSQLVANDWMLIEADAPEATRFDVHVFGDARWTAADGLVQDLLCHDVLPGARVLFDSSWGKRDQRRQQLASYCADVAQQVSQVTRR